MRRRSFLGGVAATAAASATGLGLASPGHAAGRGRAGSAARAASWELSPAPDAAPAARLVSVSAPQADAAWAVGEQGLLSGVSGRPLALRWDGSVWTHTDVTHLGLNGYLRSVSGSSGTSAWAVGDNAAGADQLLRWDGDTWRRAAYPGQDDATTELASVAAGGDGTAWASGRRNGRAGLLHYAGGSWSWTEPHPDPAAATPWRVRRSPSGSVYAVGNDVARWDGSQWTVLPTVPGIRLSIADVLPVADDDIWGVGAAFGIGGPPGKPPGVVLCHFNGTEWTFEKEGLPFSVGALNAIAGDSEGQPAVIAGWDFWEDSQAHYLRWNGTTWVGERGPASDVHPYIRDVTTVPGTAGSAWAVGSTLRTSAETAQLRIERYV